MPNRLQIAGTFALHGGTFTVRPVTDSDIQTLREWKNASRASFHFQDVISVEAQARWYEGFRRDPGQQLFVCEADRALVVCVGFRITGDTRVELFNLIAGNPDYRGTGVTSGFFDFMLQALATNGFREMELDVLTSNPAALAWYLARGFREIGAEPTFLRLRLALSPAAPDQGKA